MQLLCLQLIARALPSYSCPSGEPVSELTTAHHQQLLQLLYRGWATSRYQCVRIGPIWQTQLPTYLVDMKDRRATKALWLSRKGNNTVRRHPLRSFWNNCTLFRPFLRSVLSARGHSSAFPPLFHERLPVAATHRQKFCVSDTAPGPQGQNCGMVSSQPVLALSQQVMAAVGVLNGRRTQLTCRQLTKPSGSKLPLVMPR